MSLFLPASENFVEIVFPFAKEYLRITEQVTPEVTPEVDMPGNDMVGPIVTMQVTMQVRELIKSQQLLRAKPVPH